MRLHTPTLSPHAHAHAQTQGVEVGDTIRLGRVLALKQNGAFNVGRPYLEGVTVEATILEELRGPKVRACSRVLGRVYGCVCVCMGGCAACVHG
jgi:hypothetical protein